MRRAVSPQIFICGNHDDCLYGANIDGLGDNVHYLCNSRIEIEGLKFYGVPMFMGDCITDRQSLNYAKIPTDTDVLIILPPTASSITMTASTMARKKFLQELRGII